jgi:hypothetical protein
MGLTVEGDDSVSLSPFPKVNVCVVDGRTAAMEGCEVVGAVVCVGVSSMKEDEVKGVAGGAI